MFYYFRKFEFFEGTQRIIIFLKYKHSLLFNLKKYIKMKELNIHDGTPRVVICKKVKTGNYFPNGEILQYKRRYHISKVEVHSWYTDVYLKEFPDKNFNSVQFAECFKPEVEVKELVKANGRERKLIAIFPENNLPNIMLSKNITIDLSLYKEEIQLLEMGDAFTIGRNADCDVTLVNDAIYSRIHCYISKTITGKYALVDCSLGGTIVSL